MAADIFEERLAKVRDRFVSTITSKIDEAYAAAPKLSGEGERVIDAIAETHRRLHGIAGTGLTVGFAATGQAARQAEAILTAANKERRGLTADELAELMQALRALRQAAASEFRANRISQV